MSIANADQRVLGYLGRGLSLELSAVQLYSTQARLVDSWGLAEVAGKLSAEASEELGHAERIISRMLALGVAPNASQLRPVRLGADLRALLEHDYVFEKELVKLYSEASSYCARQGDQDNRLFFEALLAEEQAHAVSLEQWLQELQ
ncbi:MAG: bacterioferritin [Halobacteria archaeon]|nr:bacterioferritin [Halobacteria archaeon]